MNIEDLDKRLHDIEDGVKQLTLKVMERKLCDEPNTCVALQRDMIRNERQIDRNLVSINSLERWHSWMLGGGGVLLVIVTLFGPAIRYALNLPT